MERPREWAGHPRHHQQRQLIPWRIPRMYLARAWHEAAGRKREATIPNVESWAVQQGWNHANAALANALGALDTASLWRGKGRVITAEGPPE
jgi:hypothetical protein